MTGSTVELVDLRQAFTFPVAFDGDDVDEFGDDDPDDEDQDDVSAGEDEQHGVREAALAKRFNAEAAKHRKRAKAERMRAETAEAELHVTRLALAFTRANLDRDEPFKDAEVALELCDLGSVTWDDHGHPIGLNEAMEHLAERYPYLVDDSADAPSPSEPKASGRSVTRRKGMAVANAAALAKKYPALWGR